MRKGKIYIGTSGWSYKHWKGTFYPAGLKQNEQFAFYQKNFKIVEINNSFYKLPSADTFEGWKRSSKAGFVFAVKASRFLTHMKKLLIDRQGIKPFFTNVSRLGEKLGPVLFQLPPKWRMNADRLRQFIKVLPRGIRYAFEFREHSWYHPDIYDVLRKNNCAFCIYELEYHLSPVEITADFVYVRLHGPANKYQGSYTDDALRDWSARIKQWQREGLDVYVYFDNDEAGYAAFNALTLQQLVKR